MPKDASKKKRVEKVWCSHCNKMVAPNTERNHALATSIPSTSLSNSLPRQTHSPAEFLAGRRQNRPPSRSVAAEIPADTTADVGMDVDMDVPRPEEEGGGGEEAEREKAATAAADNAQERVWPKDSRRARCDDYESDEEEDDGEKDEDEDEELDDFMREEVEARERAQRWPPGAPEDDENLPSDFGDDLRHKLAGLEVEFTDDDLAYLRLFAFHTEENIRRKAYNKLPLVFTDATWASIKITRARAAFLSGLEPVLYDCCPKSCVCYVGPHADEQRCPYCKEDRFNDNHKPRARFTYIPLTPRLVSFYKDKAQRARMSYRGDYTHDASKVSDYIDGSHYQGLLSRPVVVNGIQQPYNHFNGKRDAALGAATDGFAPFNKRKRTCWPIIVFNYSLPPEIRFLLQYILCVGVAPGPNKPKDFDSFLWPLIQELLKLELGVKAYDIETDSIFTLRAYLILFFGDMPAMSMIMNMKGHNGFSPCRMCKITGLTIPNSSIKTNYVPHNRASHPAVDETMVQEYDLANLPMRTHDEILAQGREVLYAGTATESKHLSRLYGVKGISILSCLSSISFPDSFPADFMHLMYENVLKNLILLWTGEYKGLGEGTGNFHLAKKVWEAIGVATAASGSFIPGAFGARPPNIATDKQASTADSMSFWAQYIGPVLLDRKFKDEKYYLHFIELVKLITKCLQFDLSTTEEENEIDEIELGFQQWVAQYEEFYYQYDPTRIAACPVTIHTLLHVASSIRTMGPVWVYWSFPMERFCGYVKQGIRSRRYPWASIDTLVVNSAHLSHIKLQHNLTTKLSLTPPPKPLRGQFSHPDCKYPSCVLLPPHRPSSSISRSLVDKIAIHLSTRYGKSLAVVRRHLRTDDVVQYGRVRQVDGEDGDTMLASLLNHRSSDNRDATYIRYEVLVDIYAHTNDQPSEFALETFFGQLQNIFVVKLPANRDFQLTEPTTLILAAIRTCNVEGHNGLNMQYYRNHGALEVVDITAVQSLVGRIRLDKTNWWAILDRSGSLLRAVYNVEDSDVDADADD